MPDRIQLSRKKGWRMPANTVKVDRTTKWGNPFVVQANAKGGWEIVDRSNNNTVVYSHFEFEYDALLRAITRYRFYIWNERPDLDMREIRGKNLACWCNLEDRCHADVLLELANADYPPEWKKVAKQVKDEAGWRCIRCKHPHESPKERIKCDVNCDFARHPEVSGVAFPNAVDDGGTAIRLTWFEPQKQRVLTAHHLDGDKWNCRWWNLTALCQVCHLIIQAKVDMFRPWAMFEHSEWFKPYAAGFYAFRYLGLELTREQVMERLDELLALEGPLTLPTWRDITREDF